MILRPITPTLTSLLKPGILCNVTTLGVTIPGFCENPAIQSKACYSSDCRKPRLNLNMFPPTPFCQRRPGPALKLRVIDASQVHPTGRAFSGSIRDRRPGMVSVRPLSMSKLGLGNHGNDGIAFDIVLPGQINDCRKSMRRLHLCRSLLIF